MSKEMNSSHVVRIMHAHMERNCEARCGAAYMHIYALHKLKCTSCHKALSVGVKTFSGHSSSM